MNIFKTKINNYLSRNCIFIFATVTLLIIFNHIPFWDETHAFAISRLKISEILYLTRIEGHTFLWYFILKPFSSLDLYPWSMFIINWCFCMGAVFVLWKKAPFSPIIKALITFSTPFLYYFAPIARCYSIGILFLFLICAYYKKRFKHPYLFSFFILIAANTSVLVAIGSFYIGLLYLYDLFLKLKNKTFSKKKLFIVFGIFLFCAILLMLQFLGLREPVINSRADVWDVLSRFVIIPKAINVFSFILHFISAIAFYYFAFLSFKNTKQGFFFISMTYLTLTYLFLNVYSGSHWNYYFYFVYFIVFFWIFGKKILVNKFSKILFISILFLFLFPKAVHETGKMDLIYASKSKLIAKEISKNDELKNSKLYALEWWSDIAPGSILYLEKEGIDIYDIHNRKRQSFDSIKNIFYMQNELIDFDDFVENMDKNSYLIETGNLMFQKFSNLMVHRVKDGMIFQTKNKKYHLKTFLDAKNLDLRVYKIFEI